MPRYSTACHYAGLEGLSLQANCLAAVPPQLAAATNLEHVDLSRNEFLALELTGEELLAALPALEQVRLGPHTTVGAAALRSLQQRAPHLGVHTAASDSDSDEVDADSESEWYTDEESAESESEWETDEEGSAGE